MFSMGSTELSLERGGSRRKLEAQWKSLGQAQVQASWSEQVGTRLEWKVLFLFICACTFIACACVLFMRARCLIRCACVLIAWS